MQLYRLPGGAGIDSLKLVEEPAPAPGPFQALIRIRANSLNQRDLMIVNGALGKSIRADLIPLSDGAGEVVAVGDGVTRVKPGDRVAGIFMQRWLGGGIERAYANSALGGAIDGMLAEYVVLHEDGLVLIPNHLSFEEAATLPCAAVTAWHALHDHAQITAGDSVLVLGTGGVSVFALQFAHAMGARVIATSSSDAKLEKARVLGATDTINYQAVPEWQKAVLAATNGRGVDHVVEVGGAATFARSLAAIRHGGSVSLIGGLAGTADMNPTRIMLRSAKVQGVFVGSRDMFEAMNRAITQHKLRPVIDRTFPFAEVAEAFRHLELARHFGKIVISHP